ncbi:MAG: DUF4347 domain-containing protein, partial [Oscillatoriales cyanobacterium RU_3_3]|nr:DUF4347 domain-containing protein [Oscillatoriales cyanobacterium RU_3_3]
MAANSQPTGNSKLGGTWNIAQQIPPSGEVSKLALTETTLKTYSGVLGFAPKVDFISGTSSFTLPSVADTNTFNGDGKIGDINSDGKPDVVVTNLYSNTVSILLNTTTAGATTPTFATRVPFATGSGPISV